MWIRHHHISDGPSGSIRYRALLSGKIERGTEALDREVDELKAYRADLEAKREALESRDQSVTKSWITSLDVSIGQCCGIRSIAAASLAFPRPLYPVVRVESSDA